MSEDVVLTAYGEWLNDVLFHADKAEGEHIIWLSDNRWALIATEGPDILVIEIKRGNIEVAA